MDRLLLVREILDLSRISGLAVGLFSVEQAQVLDGVDQDVTVCSIH